MELSDDQVAPPIFQEVKIRKVADERKRANVALNIGQKKARISRVYSIEILFLIHAPVIPL